jgi:hypothetical protein
VPSSVTYLIATTTANQSELYELRETAVIHLYAGLFKSVFPLARSRYLRLVCLGTRYSGSREGSHSDSISATKWGASAGNDAHRRMQAQAGTCAAAQGKEKT